MTDILNSEELNELYKNATKGEWKIEDGDMYENNEWLKDIGTENDCIAVRIKNSDAKLILYLHDHVLDIMKMLKFKNE